MFKTKTMKLLKITAIGILTLALTACGGSDEKPEDPAKDIGIKFREDAVSVSQVAYEKEYEEEVTIHGEISLLNELFCPCFKLTEESAKGEEEGVLVWYGVSAEEKYTAYEELDLDTFENGDMVYVTGRLMEADTISVEEVFWAKEIEKIERN